MTHGASLGRLVRTVRHLSARQVAARIGLAARYGLYARLPAAAGFGLGGPARWDPSGLDTTTTWLKAKFPDPPSPRERQLATGAAEGRFTFLNRTRPLGNRGIDWQAGGMPRLWQYHLHYNDFVRALAHGARCGEPAWAGRALELIEDWIMANPPGRRPGWEPYPLSLRAVNWCAAMAWLESNPVAPRAEPIAASLAAQGRFLARHLEWHLGGNHLLKNAKALILLGLVLDCPEAPAWRDHGLGIFLGEMRRQVLPDGGHYERSPLYHGIVMEDLLDVLALGAPRPDLLPGSAREELRDTARRMAAWFARMRHPDGGLALFNDCVVSGEPEPAALLDYSERLLEEKPAPGATFALPDSGYYVLECGVGRAIVDCGLVGPDELPAHAHADTLSFELSWSGCRVIVDSGTAGYALDDLRRYVRCTAAHNTVRVDEVEQSEIWASHRVGRRARPVGARMIEADDHLAFAGAHDGYARLGVMHHRHVVATGPVWLVIDELLGHGRHRFESYLHLHPALRLERAGKDWRVSGGWGTLRVRPLGKENCERTEGWYCPDWGQAVRAPVLVLRGATEMPGAFGFLLAPFDLEVEVALSADDTGVLLTGGVGRHAFRIHSDRCTSSS